MFVSEYNCGSESDMDYAVEVVFLECRFERRTITNVDLGDVVTRILEVLVNVCAFNRWIVEVVEVVDDFDAFDVGGKKSIN
jgi:hypothetical protein